MQTTPTPTPNPNNAPPQCNNGRRPPSQRRHNDGRRACESQGGDLPTRARIAFESSALTRTFRSASGARRKKKPKPPPRKPSKRLLPPRLQAREPLHLASRIRLILLQAPARPQNPPLLTRNRCAPTPSLARSAPTLAFRRCGPRSRTPRPNSLPRYSATTS